MKQLEYGRQQLPWYAVALLPIGWLDVTTFEHVYLPAYYRHVVSSALGSGTMLSATVLPSLVPFVDGQWLCASIEYVVRPSASASPSRNKVDGIWFKRLDRKNADALEQPPHGHASEAALAAVPGELCRLLVALCGAGSMRRRGCATHSLGKPGQCLGVCICD